MDTDVRRVLGAILAISVLFLFFFQLISDFIAGIYSYGLSGTEIPIEIVTIVLFLTPFLLLFFKNGLGWGMLVVIGELVLVCRVIEIWLPVRFQLLVSGLGVGMFLFFFPAFLWQQSRSNQKNAGRAMAAALIVAISTSVMLRTLGLTMDLTNVGWFRILALLLAAGAAILLPRIIPKLPPATEGTREPSSSIGLGRTILLSLGLSAVFLLLYFAFSSPAVIARWTGENYLLIITLSAVTLLLVFWLLVLAGRRGYRISGPVALLVTAVFVLALTLVLNVNQTPLPDDPAAFPLPDSEPAPIWILALFAMLLLYPVLFVDFGLQTEELISTRPSMRALALGFGIGSLFMLIMILSHVFTSTWAYIDPVIEPLFRGRFWQFHLIVGVVLTLSMLAVKQRSVDSESETEGGSAQKMLAILVTILCLVTIGSALILAPDPAETAPSDQVVVAGYNILQGYGVDGQRSHVKQCELLKDIDADVIALSESDTARVAGGNFDIVRYLASCLDMHSYVGPKTGIGTFGYALLSKYPIENPETFHLYSDHGLPSSDDPQKTSGGDQVALIRGEITASGETYCVIAAHFDSNPPIEQPIGLSEMASCSENVIAVGDTNCRPDSQCFEVISEKLDHCAISSGNMSEIEGQIDHIFVTPGLSCQDYFYIENTASDHPIVTAIISR